MNCMCQGIDSFYELLAITELPNDELTSIHTHDHPCSCDS